MVTHVCKVGYVFLLVILSEFRMEQYWDDDHRVPMIGKTHPVYNFDAPSERFRYLALGLIENAKSSHAGQVGGPSSYVWKNVRFCSLSELY